MYTIREQGEKDGEKEMIMRQKKMAIQTKSLAVSKSQLLQSKTLLKETFAKRELRMKKGERTFMVFGLIAAYMSKREGGGK